MTVWPNQAGRANRHLGFSFGLGHSHVLGYRGRSPAALSPFRTYESSARFSTSHDALGDDGR
jgi:hypothetical protein